MFFRKASLKEINKNKIETLLQDGIQRLLMDGEVVRTEDITEKEIPSYNKKKEKFILSRSSINHEANIKWI